MKPNHQKLSYGMFILSMLIFGTNGLLVARISVQSSQIVLLRTLIGGALLTTIVLLHGGFDRSAIRADLPMLLLGGIQDQDPVVIGPLFLHLPGVEVLGEDEGVIRADLQPLLHARLHPEQRVPHLLDDAEEASCQIVSCLWTI